MRILFVQDSLGTGGAERSNADLWYYLRDRGIEFKIVVLEHRKVGVEKEILAEGFNVQFLQRASILKNGRELAAIIKSYRPALVHSVLFESNMRVRLAKFITPFYHVESLVNCTYAPIRFKDPRVNKLGLYLAKTMDFYSRPKGVDHSIAITQEVASHYQEQLKIPPSKLSVIFRGRHANPYVAEKQAIRRKLEEELAIPAGRVWLIHVGRQEYQKGHIYLLEALDKLYCTAQQDWLNLNVIFCGRVGNASADINAFVEKHPYLQENIHWLGHRHDIPQLLAASDVFVFPSLYEGLGGALIEAQAAALPVVCSDIPVLHEVVRAGENALMFPVANAAGLAQQLQKLISDEALRTKMSDQSLINYKNTFRLEDIHEQMLAFYRSVQPLEVGEPATQ